MQLTFLVAEYSSKTDFVRLPGVVNKEVGLTLRVRNHTIPPPHLEWVRMFEFASKFAT